MKSLIENSELTSENSDSRVFQYIEEWKSRLIDLSRKNRLLYFKHSKRGNLSIIHPNAEAVFGRLVVRKRSMEFWLPPEEPNNFQETTGSPTAVSPQAGKPASQLVCEEPNRREIEKILKKLNRRSLSDYRERGVRILHAAFGTLVWKEAKTNEEIRSPLILVPIELTRKSLWQPFTVSVPPVEETAVPNPALQVKLRIDYKIELPAFPENGDATSLADYLNSVSQTVQTLGWTVEPALEIGFFSFHKLVIYKDLEANASSVAHHPMVRAIAGVKDMPLVMDCLPEEKDVDKIENPEKIFRP